MQGEGGVACDEEWKGWQPAGCCVMAFILGISAYQQQQQEQVQRPVERRENH